MDDNFDRGEEAAREAAESQGRTYYSRDDHQKQLEEDHKDSIATETAEKMTRQNLGVSIEHFLGNIENYLAELESNLNTEGLESTVAAARIMVVANKILKSDEIVLAETTKETLLKMVELNQTASANKRVRLEKEKKDRDQRFLDENH